MPSAAVERERSTEPRGGTRTCVGCASAEDGAVEKRAPVSAGEDDTDVSRVPMVRVIIGPDGMLAIDASGARSTFGRGAYIHAAPRCVTGAATRGLPRAAKGAVSLDGERVTPENLGRAIAAAFSQRAESLLGVAKRANKLEVGSQSVVHAARHSDDHLVIVAADAAAAADLSEVRRAVAEGRAVLWGTKAELADLIRGRKTEGEGDVGVGVATVTDRKIALAIRESRHVADSLTSFLAASAPAGGGAPARRERDISPQKRGSNERKQKGSGGASPPGPSGEGGRFSAPRASQARGESAARDTSILVGGAANLREPARPGSSESPTRFRNGARRGGVKSA